MAPRKRIVGEIGVPAEPDFSDEQRLRFREGIELFNAGEFWHAHEAWERVWLAMPEGPGGDAEIVVRGMIQLAAALHLLGAGRLDGAAGNFRKAAVKLALAPPIFLGIAMARLAGFAARRSAGEDPEPPPMIEPA